MNIAAEEIMSQPGRPVIIAFDVDDTLYKIVGEAPNLYQAPDYELINVLLTLEKFGAIIVVWSAGGVDYANTIVRKLGLSEKVLVRQKGEVKVDICFDDQKVDLAKVNFWIRR